MTGLPRWADLVVEPAARAVVRDGILRTLIPEGDDSIDYYRSIGGAHMHERAAVSFAMSALDKTAYQGILQTIKPTDPGSLIVDVGGGDGRNAWPWLEWGYERVVVIDPIASALQRFRARVAERNPEWLDNVLLVEADARRLPLKAGCAVRVQAIEALYYLNDDYEIGLNECSRILSDDGMLLLSERDYEGGLLTSLLYGSLADCLAQAGTRDVWDGVEGLKVRSRCFTAGELEQVLASNGLRVIDRHGISALSLVISHMRSIGRVTEEDESRIGDVRRLLGDLAATGSMRRCNVAIAEKMGRERGTS